MPRQAPHAAAALRLRPALAPAPPALLASRCACSSARMAAARLAAYTLVMLLSTFSSRGGRRQGGSCSVQPCSACQHCPPRSLAPCQTQLFLEEPGPQASREGRQEPADCCSHLPFVALVLLELLPHQLLNLVHQVNVVLHGPGGKRNCRRVLRFMQWQEARARREEARYRRAS